MAVRGGAGAQRLLPLLSRIRPRGRKILVGASDLTYLGLALWKRFGIPFCHGPMLTRLARPDFTRAEGGSCCAFSCGKTCVCRRQGHLDGPAGKSGGDIDRGQPDAPDRADRHAPPPVLKRRHSLFRRCERAALPPRPAFANPPPAGVLDQAGGIVFGRMEGCFAPFGRRSGGPVERVLRRGPLSGPGRVSLGSRRAPIPAVDRRRRPPRRGAQSPAFRFPETA